MLYLFSMDKVMAVGSGKALFQPLLTVSDDTGGAVAQDTLRETQALAKGSTLLENSHVGEAVCGRKDTVSEKGSKGSKVHVVVIDGPEEELRTTKDGAPTVVEPPSPPEGPIWIHNHHHYQETSDLSSIECPSSVSVKHRSFDVAFKVQVAEFAEGCNNRSAGRKFGVDEKRVREWRRQKDDLKTMPSHSKRLQKKGILSNHTEMDDCTELEHHSKIESSPNKLVKKNYDASFKIAAVEFAENNSNRSTGKRFGVDEKQVREWRKQREELLKLPPSKKRLSGGGRKPAFPDLEDQLVAWIETQRANEMRITRSDIQIKAVKLYEAAGAALQFSASQGWLEKFFRRRHICL